MKMEAPFDKTAMDFQGFQENYATFLKNYTSCLGEMMEKNTRFLKGKSKEIETLLKINHVLLAPEERKESAQDATPEVDVPAGNLVDRAAEQIEAQFKAADQLLKTASMQLENLSRHNDEILTKMASGLASPSPPPGAEGEKKP